MGTVVEDATDYYSARIPKKQRKRTMVEELLSDRQFKKSLFPVHDSVTILSPLVNVLYM